MIKCDCGCEFEPVVEYRHRLLCGDSTKREDVERVMQGEKAGACVTDFPYNIGKDYQVWDDSLPAQKFWGETVPAWIDGIIAALNNRSHFITTFSERGTLMLIESATRKGFEHRHTGVWHNPNRKAGSYPGQWPFGYEPIVDFSFNGWRKLNNGNSVGYSDVWIIESPINSNDDFYHPAEKPVELYIDLIGLVSDIDEIVYEPFAGSGTTLVACQNLQRKCRAIEISPNYCAVILERMATAFPGIEIERIDNGTS